MKLLSIVGTIAMFLVGGGIINHTIPLLHHITEDTVDHLETIPAVGNIIGALTPTLMNFVIGMIAGAVVLLIVSLIQKIWPKKASNS
jgi:Uncharacterized protein conserved in bacteria